MAVRRERVVLELEDRFTSGMARAAASSALLNKELNSLSRSSVQTNRATRSISTDIDGLGKTAGRAEKDIDKLSGRLRILTEVGVALGPGLLPIGAVAVPAIAGLASQLGFAAIGTGVLVAAFNGMGDALKDLDKAALNPTTENLQKAQESLDALSPAAERFTIQIRELLPALGDLQEVAAEGVIPGFGAGLEGALTRLPALEQIVRNFSDALGNIGEDLGGAIEDGRLDEFLAFVAEEGPRALEDFGTIIGQTSLGLANMWMAFSPLNTDFSDFLVETTADFEEWSAALSNTEGFQEFIDYIRENGPQVGETLGAIGNALVQIVQAAAPLGGPVLQVIESLANALATIADSELGTPIFGLVAAMGALNLAVRAYQTVSKATFGGPALAALRGHAGGLQLVTTAQQRATASATTLAAVEARRAASFRRAAVGASGMAFALSGAADSTGLMNTATLSLLGPLGAVGGLILDLKTGSDEWAESISGVYDAIDSGDFQRLDANLASLRARMDDLRGHSGPLDLLGDIKSSFEGSDLTYKLNAVPVVGPALSGLFGSGSSANELATAAIRAGEEAMAKAAPTTDKYGNALKTTAQKAQEAKAALQDVRDEAGKNAAAFVGFDDTLDESSISLDTWIKHLNIQATALKDFATNAETATRRGLSDGLIKQLSEAGPKGALRLEQLANASETEIARANRAFGRGQEGIKQLQDVADGLEPIVVDVETAEATRKLREIKNLLLDIGAITSPGRKSGGGNDDLFKPGYAGGGWTGPGSKFTPAGVVHADEFVFSKEATHGNVALLNEMHRRMRGYANGGLVGATTSNVSNQYFGGSSIDYGQLAQAMSALRPSQPLYGDVHVHGDGSFRRALEQDQQLAGLDGIQR